MEKKIIFGVLGFSALAFIIAVLLRPAGEGPSTGVLPWQIETTATGTTRVFALEIGRDTIRNAEQRFADQAEYMLFATDAGEYAAEAYFDRIDLGGLGARVVLAADLPKSQLEEMFKRGLRISSMAQGRRRVTLRPEDVESVRAAPIGTLTYLPAVNLDESAIRGRFGEPAYRLRERDGEALHLLYPKIGLDITVHPKEKEVFQYVAPAQFDRLLEPLRQRSVPAS